MKIFIKVLLEIIFFGRSSIKISFISGKRFDNISSKDFAFGLGRNNSQKFIIRICYKMIKLQKMSIDCLVCANLILTNKLKFRRVHPIFYKCI